MSLFATHKSFIFFFGKLLGNWEFSLMDLVALFDLAQRWLAERLPPGFYWFPDYTVEYMLRGLTRHDSRS